MTNISRRGFVGAAALGAVTMAAGVGVASAEEAAGYQYMVEPQMDWPWSGPGSETGDWTGTPEEYKAIGGCTMPLDELNRRRKLYIDAQTDWTCEDGTVIPAVYTKVRALINTYGYGVGNAKHDHCFDWPMHEMTEDEAQAFLDMPWGMQFTTLEFSEHSGYSLEDCEAYCDALFSHGWLCRAVTDRGVQYSQVACVLGLDEYHLPDIFRGDSSVADFINIAGADSIPIAFHDAGSLFFNPTPVSPSVVKDGAILPLDDIVELFKSKNKFSVSPCCCRGLGTLGAGETLPNYPDGDFDLRDFVSPVCGHDVETCLCCGEEAQFWIDHKVGREITLEEALERLQKSVEDGFVIQRMNTKEAETVCSCHGDCCGILKYWKSVGSSGRTYNNISHYTLEVTTENCLQCGLCADRCPMAVITMDEETGYPVITGDPCVVCGQCAYICPTQSRLLVPKPEGTYVPLFDDIVADNNMLAAERFEAGLIW